MPIELSVHTMEISCTIADWQAKLLCNLYGVPLHHETTIPPSQIKIPGVDEISLSAKRIPPKPGEKTLWLYDVTIRINAGRLTDLTDHRMLTLTNKNAGLLLRAVQDQLLVPFSFWGKHKSIDSWKIKRLDCGMDIILPVASQKDVSTVVEALNKEFKVGNRYGIIPYTYQGYQLPEKKSESVSLTTQSGSYYRINIYDKLNQLEHLAWEQNRPLSKDEKNEVRHLLRIEFQISDVNKFINEAKPLTMLGDPDKRQKIIVKEIKTLKAIFGPTMEAIVNQAMTDQRMPRPRGTFAKVYKVRLGKGKYRYQMTPTLTLPDGRKVKKTFVSKINASSDEADRELFLKYEAFVKENCSACHSFDELETYLNFVSSEIEGLKTLRHCDEIQKKLSDFFSELHADAALAYPQNFAPDIDSNITNLLERF